MHFGHSYSDYSISKIKLIPRRLIFLTFTQRSSICEIFHTSPLTQRATQCNLFTTGRPKLKERTKHRLVEIISLEKQLRDEEVSVNSESIGAYLGTSGDSIRRDIMATIPQKGKTHYEQRELGQEIADLFGFDQPVEICLVGMGSLGQYLLETMKEWPLVKAALIFDTKINRLERLNQRIPGYPAWEITEILPGRAIKTAILTTSAEEAEKNAQRLFQSGIKYLLNLTGYYLRPPHGGIKVKNINLLSEILCLKADIKQK